MANFSFLNAAVSLIAGATAPRATLPTTAPAPTLATNASALAVGSPTAPALPPVGIHDQAAVLGANGAGPQPRATAVPMVPPTELNAAHIPAPMFGTQRSDAGTQIWQAYAKSEGDAQQRGTPDSWRSNLLASARADSDWRDSQQSASWQPLGQNSSATVLSAASANLQASAASPAKADTPNTFVAAPVADGTALPVAKNKTSRTHAHGKDTETTERTEREALLVLQPDPDPLLPLPTGDSPTEAASMQTLLPALPMPQAEQAMPTAQPILIDVPQPQLEQRGAQMLQQQGTWQQWLPQSATRPNGRSTRTQAATARRGTAVLNAKSAVSWSWDQDEESSSDGGQALQKNLRR